MDTAKLDKAVDYFIDQIKFIHASGGGNLILEEVKCDVYNSKMRIKELGTVNSLGAGAYVVNLWDMTIAEEVKKSIMNSINLNANVDGGTLKVVFPAPTQEKRLELGKLVSKYAEDCLIAIRNIRRDEMTQIDKDFKEKIISEDQKKTLENKVEDVIKQFNKKVEELKGKKIIEINTI
ncbi:MAG: ribosome-recycling factor [bacterium]